MEGGDRLMREGAVFALSLTINSEVYSTLFSLRQVNITYKYAKEIFD